MIEQFKLSIINRASWLLGNRAVENEHFVPKRGLDVQAYIAAGDRTGAHHLIRYAWALDVLGQHSLTAPILDVACGAGYGSYMLANALPDVQIVGADYDAAAVRYAQAHYRLPNLKFQHGDVLRWSATLGDDRYGAVVSFDTLEHCPHREIMLEHLVEHLADDGLLLLSTPCGHEENQLRPRWPHHKIEYAAASLYDLLRRYFHNVQRPEEPDFPGLGNFDLFTGTAVSYYLRLNPVLCSEPIRVVNPYKDSR